MKRFITLILMLTTLLTFTQKVMAFAPLLENEAASMNNCPMSMQLISMGSMNNAMDMDHSECSGNEMVHTMDCQNDCDFMTVISVLYFIEHEHRVNQPYLQLSYQSTSSPSPYYFPESLYRPPFLS